MTETTETRQHPILFSGPMIRAILDGRKGVTRRIIKPQPKRYEAGGGWGLTWGKKLKGGSDWLAKYCPYGQVGGRLWVRETWRETFDIDQRPVMEYRAGGTRMISEENSTKRIAHGEHRCTSIPPKWRPPIFMPRWASRITLEITAVHVEQLQQITRSGAILEGAQYHDGGGIGHSGWRMDDSDVFNGPVSAFVGLWDRLNGKTFPWESNAWVWVVNFRRVK